jgi:hypothetical protein
VAAIVPVCVIVDVVDPVDDAGYSDPMQGIGWLLSDAGVHDLPA